MRSRLETAALALAAKHGLAGVTIDAVIVEAQVSRGTFYKYFDSLSTMIQSLGQVVSDELLAAMNPSIMPLEDPALRIASGVHTVLALAKSQPLLGGFMVHSGWPALDVTPAFNARVGQTLAQGISQGRFANMPTELAMSVTVGTILGAMKAVITQPEIPGFAQTVAEAILRALGLSAPDAHNIAAKALTLDLGETRLFASLD